MNSLKKSTVDFEARKKYRNAICALKNHNCHTIPIKSVCKLAFVVVSTKSCWSPVQIFDEVTIYWAYSHIFNLCRDNAHVTVHKLRHTYAYFDTVHESKCPSIYILSHKYTRKRNIERLQLSTTNTKGDAYDNDWKLENVEVKRENREKTTTKQIKAIHFGYFESLSSSMWLCLNLNSH